MLKFNKGKRGGKGGKRGETRATRFRDVPLWTFISLVKGSKKGTSSPFEQHTTRDLYKIRLSIAIRARQRAQLGRGVGRGSTRLQSHTPVRCDAQ